VVNRGLICYASVFWCGRKICSIKSTHFCRVGHVYGVTVHFTWYVTQILSSHCFCQFTGQNGPVLLTFAICMISLLLLESVGLVEGCNLLKESQHIGCTLLVFDWNRCNNSMAYAPVPGISAQLCVSINGEHFEQLFEHFANIKLPLQWNVINSVNECSPKLHYIFLVWFCFSEHFDYIVWWLCSRLSLAVNSCTLWV
jgi:hypothetical protein